MSKDLKLARSVRVAVFSFFLLTVLYGLSIIWLSKSAPMGLERYNSKVIFLVISLTIFSWFIRGIRWWWLIRSLDIKVQLFKSLYVYIAGFAFTATPGKVGELMRARYLNTSIECSKSVFAAFVFERFMDLLVVLMLGVIFFYNTQYVGIGIAFIAVVIGVITMLIFLVQGPFFARRDIIDRGLLNRFVRAIVWLQASVDAGKKWMNFRDLSISILCGFVAWGSLSLAFVVMLFQFAPSVDCSEALGVYPLAMVVGAASFIPGGIGSTEAAIVALLTDIGIVTELAIAVAVGIRVSTLWLAVMIGLIVAIKFELELAKAE